MFLVSVHYSLLSLLSVVPAQAVSPNRVKQIIRIAAAILKNPLLRCLIICLPIIAVASVIRIATIAVINCGAYLLGPVMSFLLFGIVYTVCMQQWNQAAVFVILEVACGFLLYATAAIAATSQSIADGLLGFIRQ